jgi:hypothetical protein
MSEKSPRKESRKNKGKTLKERQHEKKVKQVVREGRTSNIPPTGH